MIDRSRIGFATEPSLTRIDSRRVRLFCKAMGKLDVVYWDFHAAEIELVNGSAQVRA